MSLSGNTRDGCFARIRMDSQNSSDSKKHYRVLIDSLVTEGRVFHRSDTLTADDAPGEIESMLHAGLIEALTEKPAPKAELR